MDVGGTIRQAEEAVARGDLHVAISLFKAAAEAQPDDLALWMKLAAIHRGTGDVRAALDAVHRALAIAPRDFTALLMRASLLEKLGDGAAGEAWTHALAQRPAGELPPHLARVVADAERHSEAWLDARASRMAGAMADAEKRADAEEIARMERFRSNALRRTRTYHCEPTHFHFPGLREREFHPRSLFPWLQEVEAATETIAAELRAVMSAERAELVPYIQYSDHAPMDQWRTLNRNPDWTAIHLLQNGREISVNSRHCPRTMELLQGLPQPQVKGASPNAMFSLLAPHTTIPAHVGVANTRLICHLPLIVPEGCWFRVGAETRYWREGEAFVFDDSIEHEAQNPTDELRVVLIFDVWHPDLTPVERAAVAALIASETMATGL